VSDEQIMAPCAGVKLMPYKMCIHLSLNHIKRYFVYIYQI